MRRRQFLQFGAAATGLFASSAFLRDSEQVRASELNLGARFGTSELEADVVIIGGGLGGCAAALAALRNGLNVIMTEETDWIGGQLTSQAVPPDEHRWIETHGATALYRRFRESVREYYRRHYPLTDDARARVNLNPGDGSVSRLCHEPRVALAVFLEMFNPYFSTGRFTLLLEHKAISADVSGDTVRAIKVINRQDGKEYTLKAPHFIDATELGDLLPMTGTEFRIGSESRSETNELHAPEVGNPLNHQAFTVIFAMDYDKDGNHVIDKPPRYDFWRDFVPVMEPPWPGRLLDLTYSHPYTLIPTELGFHPEGVNLTGADGSWMLNLWNYRRIINQNNFLPGTHRGDITIVNWPQNDYVLGNLDGSEEEFAYHFARGKELSLSLFYWLQTEAPRPDGGQGWAGLRLRSDVLGTSDGMAKYPYVRESRRIKALFTILEEHIGKQQRESITGQTEEFAAPFFDSVGVGYYQIDLHPSTAGVNYIDFPALRFQIPLGALLPQRMLNLLPANKNIGSTHITNGCYRLHPIEWNIGESAGMLVVFAQQKNVPPRAVRETPALLDEFQNFIRLQGIETHWQTT